ncbi:MAG: arsenic resistance N-acetyltransferase ArsN2 [Mucilaginibacter sp.]
MKTEQADNYRESIIALLAAEKLPTTDLPETLETFLVTKHDDEITGVVGLEIYGDFALLRSLAVDRGYRNRGLANTLLGQIEGLASSKKLKAIYLLTETAPDYFSRKGYDKITRADVPAEVQQSSEFSHVCPQSAIVMRKTL